MTHSTRKLGSAFTWLSWIIGLAMLTLLFNKVIEDQHNPNQNIQGVSSGQVQELQLERNRYGHYVFNGRINGHEVTFLVDTGATTTAIPANLQNRLGLSKGPAFPVQTANGRATAYATNIDSLELGIMRFSDIRASLNPGMQGDEILLGMNVLKNLELVQRGNLLILRRHAL